MPTERAIYVRAMVAKVESLLSQNKTKEQIKEEVPDFVENYTHLFNAVTSDEQYDKQSLKTMLTLLDNMGSGNLSQHQASVIVGKKLGDKYIKVDDSLPSSSS